MAEKDPIRSMTAKLAAHESWARTPNRSARTAKARAALMAKFEREVDPDGTLPVAERARRAEHARKAYYTRLALKSAKSRRDAARLTVAADAADAELREVRA
ncbi:hypothetical protein ACTXPS_12180 [Brachybacterium tyrofermentans]|uniref:hypothetical protein n=1 Tax=Brachybacterium tyrofermentans TaxID=47848 RepID=UPI003FD6B7B6